jgi:hypothetical protein
MKKLTRLDQLELEAQARGLTVRTWSPGDGITRYRFFRIADLDPSKRQSYSGPKNGIETVLGFQAARWFIDAYGMGRNS